MTAGPRLKFVLITYALFALASCASQQVPINPLPAGTDPSQEISLLDQDLKQATSQQVDMLSPQNFVNAQNALKETKSLRTQGASNQDILRKAAEARSYLDRAMNRAQVARTVTGNVQAARSEAISAGAQQYFKSDFEKADRDFRDLTMSIESGSSKVSQNDLAMVNKEYKQLALKATKQRYLGESQKTINEAKNEGAEDYAPKTLAQTERSASQLNALISRNMHDPQIQGMAGQTKQQADQLLKITRQAKLIKSRNPEETALQMNKQQQQIANLGTQSQQASQQVAALQGEKAISDRFNQVKSMFNPSEADVVRTDHSMVIRLKGLEFQKARNEVPPQDFDLLKRVETAINTFPSNRIVIAGNTDSTGGKKANQALSLDRAESVKNFLVASNAALGPKIDVKGNGFSEPIASNKTPEGRALNRRVDIILEAATG